MRFAAALRSSDNPRDQILADETRELSNWQHFLGPLHKSIPSQRLNNGEDGVDMLPPINGRNTRGLTNDREQTRDTLTERFKVHVTEPSKVAARKLGKSAETVDAYRQIGVPQSWADMVECCRKYPAFALDVVEAMGLDIDRDRESYAIFLSLQLQMQGRGR